MRKIHQTLALLTLLLGAAISLHGQPDLPATNDVFSLDTGSESSRQPVASLAGLWRFHPGDNSQWADPRFDDSTWPLLRADQDWGRQGYKGVSGLAWYRFKIVIPSSIEEVSIYLPPILTNYELFADGVRIGTYGKMPPNPSVFTQGYGSLLYSIPPSPVSPRNGTRTVTIALRVWMWPVIAPFIGGGPAGPNGLVGETSQMERRRDLNLARIHWASTSAQTITILETLVTLGALTLFLLRRKETEYLWFSLMMLTSAIAGWMDISSIEFVWRDTVFELGKNLLDVAGTFASIAFYMRLLRPRPTWLLKLAIASLFLLLLSELQFHLLPGLLNVSLGNLLGTILELPVVIWTIAMLFTQAFSHRTGISPTQRTDARLLLFPVLLQESVSLLASIFWITYTLGWRRNNDQYITLATRPFPINLLQVTDALFLLGVFAILVLRFTRTRSQEERYASEVEGARAVQQFLIPENLPVIAGFTIESDYRPAREVSGDFFQVIPDSTDGSVLILAGDVAGKGLQAGMLASLLVGAIRTAVTFTTDPSLILSTLNNRLQGKGNATCLALLIESNGAATLVNAGHLPPYLNGQELPMEGALPLGMIPGIDFPVLQFQVDPGDKLTLISDGILEAQKPSGELFGFERISELLSKSNTASSLATAAQEFGQEDDITVLTILRKASSSTV